MASSERVAMLSCSLCIHLDGLIIKNGDISNDVKGGGPVDVYNEGDTVVWVVGRAVRGNIFYSDRGGANEAMLVGWRGSLDVFSSGNEDN